MIFTKFFYVIFNFLNAYSLAMYILITQQQIVSSYSNLRRLRAMFVYYFIAHEDKLILQGMLKRKQLHGAEW